MSHFLPNFGLVYIHFYPFLPIFVLFGSFGFYPFCISIQFYPFLSISIDFYPFLPFFRGVAHKKHQFLATAGTVGDVSPSQAADLGRNQPAGRPLLGCQTSCQLK